jgi:hypothetical protein
VAGSGVSAPDALVTVTEALGKILGDGVNSECHGAAVSADGGYDRLGRGWTSQDRDCTVLRWIAGDDIQIVMNGQSELLAHRAGLDSNHDLGHAVRSKGAFSIPRLAGGRRSRLRSRCICFRFGQTIFRY